MDLERIKLMLAVWASRLVMLLCRIARFRGSALPGKYALRLCPAFLAAAAAQVRKKIIVVCGTNGKTTTNNLIASAAELEGFAVVCNRAGANMLNGIAAAFAQKMDFLGRLDCDYACIEADEATLPLLFDHFTADVICATNLFRDQLDRYGEIDIASALLKKAFDKAPDAVYVLNADDPVTSVFGNDRQAYYYGIMQNTALVCCDEVRDGGSCQLCGQPLCYDYYNYGQLGRYRCAGCGCQNPLISVGADAIYIKDGELDFDIVNTGGLAGVPPEAHIHSGVAGLYNVYNMLAAYCVCAVAGVCPAAAAEAMAVQQPEPGRMSRFEIGGKCVYLVLSKNPTGFNQSVTSVLNDCRPKDLLLVLNDNAQDGEDISWIWDVDFESLMDSGAHCTITGQRRYDMYLRLKYAGYEQDRLWVKDDITSALAKMLESDKNVYYALVNYTAMYPAYVALTKLAQKGVL